MIILPQTTETPSLSVAPVLTYYEVAYLQTADDIQIFEFELETARDLDGAISTYDYLYEVPTPELLTFGRIWLPSTRKYIETTYYLVTRDVYGCYAIYRKAWL